MSINKMSFGKNLFYKMIFLSKIESNKTDIKYQNQRHQLLENGVVESIYLSRLE